MEDAIAFKVNTAEALTTIKYGYMSVGRMGNAIPMLKVEPVEVNETIVEDVSLGSYDKYAAMDLHENETIIVYSAGDVIPQIKIPENREYPKTAEYLKIKKRCSYCEDKLERIGNEYKCTNSECIRIITGKITNFLTKLGVENVSDKTVEDLFNAKLLRSIKDLFSLEVGDISKLQGYGEASANNIVEEIKKLTKKEISVSSLFGALGIQDIGEKKCRKMFQEITLEDALEKSKKKIVDKVLQADNIGVITAEIFTDFILDNRNLIRFLLDNMNIKMDKKYKGNVVFTGFRDDNLTKKLDEIGYEVSTNVTSNTVAVISATNNEKSTKCMEAKRKGKSIVNIADVDKLLDDLKRNKNEDYYYE
jgi:DNA ligase (NAD+)